MTCQHDPYIFGITKARESLLKEELRRIFWHFFGQVPCMNRKCKVKREEDLVADRLATELEQPDSDRDVNLEYQHPPPFSEIPVSQPGEHEVEKTGDQRILDHLRPFCQTTGEVHQRDPDFW